MNCHNCWGEINEVLQNASKKLAISEWNYEVNVTYETAKIFVCK